MLTPVLFHDIQLFKVLKPALLLPFLSDALQGYPCHHSSGDLCQAVVPVGQRAISIRPFSANQSDERGQREAGLAAPRKYDREDVDGAVSSYERRGGKVFGKMDWCKCELFYYGEGRVDCRVRNRTNDDVSAKQRMVHDSCRDPHSSASNATSYSELEVAVRDQNGSDRPDVSTTYTETSALLDRQKTSRGSD